MNGIHIGNLCNWKDSTEAVIRLGSLTARDNLAGRAGKAPGFAKLGRAAGEIAARAQRTRCEFPANTSVPSDDVTAGQYRVMTNLHKKLISLNDRSPPPGCSGGT
ncbi:hypothetical protein Y032_0526g2950 [Ancylostoma ceylanicum]|uniref:Uncharacterized protein n=1 Tax=Ancylostoma ceylanicum TaxID=53326 RepID=A0A016WUA4_9BILA|nr:hypothetical protein Y032_0526g2950 [Ancylostoma ceylanicum]